MQHSLKFCIHFFHVSTAMVFYTEIFMLCIAICVLTDLNSFLFFPVPAVEDCYLYKVQTGLVMIPLF